MSDALSEWISRLESGCSKVDNNHCYLIIDQTALDFAVIPALNLMSVEWHSLWRGLPEESAENDAPLLIKILFGDLQQQRWLSEFCREASPKHAVIAICSLWPGGVLATWLQGCVDARHEGRAGLLRFYDPRVFPILLDAILHENQIQQLLRPALFWSWMDRDCASQFKPGDGRPGSRSDNIEHIDLSDSQFESHMCVCDVNITLKQQLPSFTTQCSKKQLFNNCYAAMLEADSQGLIIDAERGAFALMRLNEFSN